MGFSPSFVKLRASQSERDKVWIDLKFSRQFYYICSAFAREAAHKLKGVRFPLILCLRRQKSQLCNLPGIILSKVTCRDFFNRKMIISAFLVFFRKYMHTYIYIGEVLDVNIIDFSLPRQYSYANIIFSHGLSLNFYENRTVIFLKFAAIPPLNSPYALSAFLPRLICTGRKKKERRKIRNPATRDTTTYPYLVLNRVLKASRVNQLTGRSVLKRLVAFMNKKTKPGTYLLHAKISGANITFFLFSA